MAVAISGGRRAARARRERNGTARCQVRRNARRSLARRGLGRGASSWPVIPSTIGAESVPSSPPVLGAQRFPGLTTAHMGVFQNIDHPPEGTRQTELAARMQITKHALGEVVDALEGGGYAERLADPTDRRAKLEKVGGTVTMRERPASPGPRVAHQPSQTAEASEPDEKAAPTAKTSRKKSSSKKKAPAKTASKKKSSGKG